MSPIALVGGNEFRRDCVPMDQALLALAGGPGTAMAILPTASTNENPEVAGANGVRHFNQLGAVAEKLMIVDEESAADEGLANQLAASPFVYFTGGDPPYLLETLRGSRAWAAVLEVHRGGGLVAGSSAGAMALGGRMWRFDGWTDGLGLAPTLAVLPHHATLGRRWGAERLAVGLPRGVILVGIDEATALLLPEGRVLGVGQVTVYGSDGPKAYVAGGAVSLSGAGGRALGIPGQANGHA